MAQHYASAMEKALEKESQILNSGLRLADHFPAVLPNCKEQAVKFFFCFTSHGESKNPTDVYAGKQALTMCHNLMQDYDNCMIKEIELKKKKTEKK